MHLLEKENETIGANFREFTSKMEKKFETFEKKIDMLRNTLDEKERAILALEIRLNEREKSVDEKLKKLDSKKNLCLNVKSAIFQLHQNRV